MQSYINLGLPFALFAAVAAIFYGVITSFRIISKDPGSPKMRQISDAIAQGASAYLARQYSVIAVVAVVIFAAIAFLLSLETAIGFAIGAAALAPARRRLLQNIRQPREVPIQQPKNR